MFITSIQHATGLSLFAAKEPKEILEVLEFGRESLAFDAPKGVALQRGHLLLLKGHVDFESQRQQFSITAAIVRANNVDGRIRVEVELRQYEKGLWQRILEWHKREQSRVDTLLSSIKGES